MGGDRGEKRNERTVPTFMLATPTSGAHFHVALRCHIKRCCDALTWTSTTRQGTEQRMLG